jgi:dermatan/chondrotin sulfate uronyl 2-O-sulfotransferase UST
MNIDNRQQVTTIILYNRVPKCGSSLMNMLLDLIAKKAGRFQLIQSNEYDHHRLTISEQEQLRHSLESFTRQATHKTIVFERHFHFVQFESNDKYRLHYINQIRDPLDRALSYYDYVRYICQKYEGKSPCMLTDLSLQNITMEQCVSTGDPTRCVNHTYGIRSAIAFFCGQSSVCHDDIMQSNQKTALELAKFNIERYYKHVGLLEYFDSSLELLEYNQPLLFVDIRETYRQILKSGVVHATPAKFRHSISNRTREILRGLLKYEYELYDFVRQRFFDEYTRAFHRSARTSRPGMIID